MKLHFDFNLAYFRISKTVIKNESEATVYGYSKELGGLGCIKLYGEDKIAAFSREITNSKFSSNVFLLYSGKTIFAVSIIPNNCPKDINYIDMNGLDYLLVHEGSKHMNGLMNLETLNAYMDYWMNKFGPSPLN